MATPTVTLPLVLWRAVRVDRLTPREQDVLRCVAAGLTTAQTAQRLGMGRNTARTRMQWIFEKTGVQSRAQLAVWAVLTGLVTPEEILAIWREMTPELMEGARDVAVE